MKLYNYFRSGTSHRVRIAMGLKNVKAQYVPVDLAGDLHLNESFGVISPQNFVPVLELDDGTRLIQSPAILEWLEEKYPEPSLLPKDSAERVHVRALAAIVGCDTHPLNNKRILQQLRRQFGADEEVVNAWCSRWISAAFDALESMLACDTSRKNFCFGGRPTMADIYLIPQVESARRYNVDLDRWPLIKEVDKSCNQIEAFVLAAPSQQIDHR
jgi:maleylpyruvate isomerase